MTPNTSSSTSSETPACGLLRRLAAMIYDGLLLVAIWMVATALIVIPLDAEVGTGNPLFQLYLLIISWAYFAICWRGGKTLGMKAWRIRIEGSETPISWYRSLIRFAVAIPALLIFGLGFFWSLFHPNRATWHDLASGTRLLVEPKAQRKSA
jgi:uncharacterized RDD family membrane protein YckC